MNKVKNKVIPKILATIIIVCLVSSATILYIPQQTHAQSAAGILNVVKIGIEIVGSLIDLYDTAKSHMTPKESVVTGNGINEITTERYYEAANSFDQALQINRENLVALNGKGILALRSVDTYANVYEAMNFFDRALQIDPNDLTALQGKGITLKYTGNNNGAMNFFDRALQIDPTSLVALNGKGLALADSGDPYEAMNFFDRALQIDPNDLTALTLKAHALTLSGNYNEAIRIYDKVLEISPNNHDALYERSVVLDLQEFEIDPSKLKCG